MSKRECNKRYYEKYKERLREQNRNYEKAHREEANARSKKHYIKNRVAKITYQKEYYRKYRKEHREEAKAYAVAYRKKRFLSGEIIGGWLANKYLTVPCMDCNVIHPYYVMDFDHRPDEIKSFNIARMNQYAAKPDRISILMKEIDKCDYICANCHRVRTQERYK